ncbi:unnamed protein product, partial [Linum tenue]
VGAPRQFQVRRPTIRFYLAVVVLVLPPQQNRDACAYTPAFLAALSSLLLLHHGGDGASSSRLFLVESALAVHFFKRVFESKLRSSGDDGKKKEYKIPKGGMFELVICPHYLFEILGFYGIALISQTLYSFYGSRCMKILYNRYELLWKQVSILRNSVLTWLVSLDPINTLDKIPARN